MDRITTGSPQTDTVLGGGLPKNSINILMGLPGTGKTVFAQQLAFANAESERPVLYLTTVSEPLALHVTHPKEALPPHDPTAPRHPAKPRRPLGKAMYAPPDRVTLAPREHHATGARPSPS